MTPADLRAIVEQVGGPQALAKRLGMGRDWVYRRLRGENRITPVDEVAILAATKSRASLRSAPKKVR